jgi:tellurite methyltransferase
MINRSVQIFDQQFQQQVQQQDFVLNPFEIAALEYLTGDVLDYGCGLGNFTLEAARRGHSVYAVDASSAAIAHIQSAADDQNLPVQAVQADLVNWQIHQPFATIAAIGILTYFRRQQALQMLRSIQENVKSGGRAIVNSLIVGTTFLDLFDGDHYYLFAADEIESAFDGWTILASLKHEFEAPNQTIKVLSTVIAEKN